MNSPSFRSPSLSQDQLDELTEANKENKNLQAIVNRLVEELRKTNKPVRS